MLNQVFHVNSCAFLLHGMFSELQVTSAEELGWFLVDTGLLAWLRHLPRIIKVGSTSHASDESTEFLPSYCGAVSRRFWH